MSTMPRGTMSDFFCYRKCIEHIVISQTAMYTHFDVLGLNHMFVKWCNDDDDDDDVVL